MSTPAGWVHTKVSHDIVLLPHSGRLVSLWLAAMYNMPLQHERVAPIEVRHPQPVETGINWTPPSTAAPPIASSPAPYHARQRHTREARRFWQLPCVIEITRHFMSSSCLHRLTSPLSSRK